VGASFERFPYPLSRAQALLRGNDGGDENDECRGERGSTHSSPSTTTSSSPCKRGSPNVGTSFGRFPCPLSRAQALLRGNDGLRAQGRPCYPGESAPYIKSGGEGGITRAIPALAPAGPACGGSKSLPAILSNPTSPRVRIDVASPCETLPCEGSLLVGVLPSAGDSREGAPGRLGHLTRSELEAFVRTLSERLGRHLERQSLLVRDTDSSYLTLEHGMSLAWKRSSVVLRCAWMRECRECRLRTSGHLPHCDRSANQGRTAFTLQTLPPQGSQGEPSTWAAKTAGFSRYTRGAVEVLGQKKPDPLYRYNDRAQKRPDVRRSWLNGRRWPNPDVRWKPTNGR
jgi:hypothetical protein